MNQFSPLSDPRTPFVQWGVFQPSLYRGPSEDPYCWNLVCLLPEGSFLRSWVSYGISISDCHAAYHLGNALALMSVMVPTSVVFPDGDKLAANFYSMVIGPSGGSRKTFSVKRAGEVLLAVAREYYLTIPGSVEWLTDRVIAKPKALLVIEEGANFFDMTSRQGGSNYMKQLRPKLMELADGTAQMRATRDKERVAKLTRAGKTGAALRPEDDPDRLEVSPRLSMMMATAPEHIQDHTLISDWMGGYMPRKCMFYGEAMRSYDSARLNNDALTELEAHLAQVVKIRNVGPCAGVGPDADRFYQAWRGCFPSRELDVEHSTFAVGEGQGAVQVPRTLRPLIDRSQDHARKAAMLAAYDEHVARCLLLPSAQQDSALLAPWGISLRHMAFGCGIASIHIASGWKMIGDVAMTEEQRLMLRALRFIRKHGGVAPASEIYRVLGVTKRRTDELLNTLVSMAALDGWNAALAWTAAARFDARVVRVNQGLDP